MEMYSPEGVAELCGWLGLKQGCSLDLTSGFDVDKSVDRPRAWENIQRDQPLLAIGSPPCTCLSTLNEVNRHLHRGDPTWLQRFENNLEKAKRHFRCCCRIYNRRVRQGRYLLREHPWLARSWGMDCIREVETLQGVVRVRLDMF